MNNFKNLKLSDSVLSQIEGLGFINPSEIQELLIPLIMDGKDVIGQANTGTGKTLAYAASVLSVLNSKDLSVIVLVPTRELAVQVTAEFNNLINNNEFKVLSVYGGSSIENQIKELKKGVNIVVGTPGRMMDLMKRKVLNTSGVKHFILDEADEMLDMGFLPDIKEIFDKVNPDKQVILLSATMPSEIKNIAKNYMKDDFEHVSVVADTKTSSNVSHYYYLVSEKTRLEALCHILDYKGYGKVIIFCRTKRDCDELSSTLKAKHYKVRTMHGDITQAVRIKTLDDFKDGSYNILIATDVAARGIHVNDVDAVVNYKIPDSYEAYIHRIGRTGRVTNTGEAINLVTKIDLRFIQNLERNTGCKINYAELPSEKDITSKKYEDILLKVKEVIDKKKYEENIVYFRDYNKDDLLKYCSSLLKMVMDYEIGSNFDKSVTVTTKEKKPKEVQTDRVRFFLTVGIKDDIRKNDLVHFILKNSHVTREQFTNIEVLQSFTFIDVDNNVSEIFMEELAGRKLNGNPVRIEKAKRNKK